MYKLYQDKKEKGIFKTENEALAWLQKNYFSSWDYAFKYGGWELIEVVVCGTCGKYENINDAVCTGFCPPKTKYYMCYDCNEESEEAYQAMQMDADIYQSECWDNY
jgi:hypothetical protein